MSLGHDMIGCANGGCDNMTIPEQLLSGRPGPMIATLWRRGGKMVKIECEDCEVQVGPYLTEIMLHTPGPRSECLMFIVSDDPDVQADMLVNGRDTAAFESFQLRDFDGTIIEQLSVFDSKAVN